MCILIKKMIKITTAPIPYTIKLFIHYYYGLSNIFKRPSIKKGIKKTKRTIR